ncbi:hypothetical protein [Paenibacillus ehimensis]|uniref:Alpha/beta hydrolase n=1 Tax=Paenibacillus ehimensis TaxID=79264 RepID=A0ABT8VE51_9BACL|nr:hypothetical protein [Paenibacillus ehimensis]MDO3679240.1 hypothetical protein [Paenibacillus ehimensis]MEC0207864.1 hypothetical protein [Paenibacillus ehimensis]
MRPRQDRKEQAEKVVYPSFDLEEDKGADYAIKEHANTAIGPVLVVNGG